MSDVRLEQIGTAGVITLDRPDHLNALTHDMVRRITAALKRWRQDAAIRHVIIRAVPGRAFSAGGDIRDLYDRGRSHYPDMMEFFADEYRLDTMIREFEKPFIALIDGIVMGGGVGVSVNGRYRVATQNIRFAMPEVGIGFFPDVGATYFLPRVPGRIGHYCALTGARLDRAEAAKAGIVTHVVDAAALDGLFDALTRSVDALDVLETRCARARDVAEFAHSGVVADCFAADRVEEILDRLDRHAGDGEAFAAGTAELIRAKSPTSLKIAERQMQYGATADFRACMTIEYRIVSHVLHGHDFYEGVRATIIDKDGRPNWRPGRLDQVDEAEIDMYFTAPAQGDLDFSAD